jgi:hypothetical protein
MHTTHLPTTRTASAIRDKMERMLGDNGSRAGRRTVKTNMARVITAKAVFARLSVHTLAQAVLPDGILRKEKTFYKKHNFFCPDIVALLVCRLDFVRQ